MAKAFILSRDVIPHPTGLRVAYQESPRFCDRRDYVQKGNERWRDISLSRHSLFSMGQADMCLLSVTYRISSPGGLVKLCSE